MAIEPLQCFVSGQKPLFSFARVLCVMYNLSSPGLLFFIIVCNYARKQYKAKFFVAHIETLKRSVAVLASANDVVEASSEIPTSMKYMQPIAS